MGPAAAAIIPAGVGLIGSIIGSNSQNHAANAAQGAADQAAAGQNAINSQLMGIFNQLFQSYQQNYAPQQGPLSSNLTGLSGANAGAGQNLSTYLTQLLNPSAVESQTGIPTTAATQDIFGTFMNPQNSQLAKNLPGVTSGIQGANAMQQIAGAGVGNDINAIQGTQPTFARALAQTNNVTDNLTGLLNNGPVAQTTPQVLNYLSQPGATNLAQSTPGALSYFNNPGATNLAHATPGAMSLFGQTAATGISPDLISQAVQQNDVAAQRGISTLRNELGAGLPNVSGTVQDLLGQEFQSNAGLLAGLEGQSQGLKLQAAQAGLNAAGAADTQHAGMTQAGLGAAAGLDTQTQGMLTQLLQAAGYSQNETQGILQQMQSTAQQSANIASQQAGAASQGAQAAGIQSGIYGQSANTSSQLGQAAGNYDQQMAQWLSQALGIGQGASATTLGNTGLATSTATGIDQLIQQFISSGQAGLTSAISGTQNIGNQYANAGTQAANNLTTTNAQNPFQGFANTIGGLNWGSIVKQPPSASAPVATAAPAYASGGVTAPAYAGPAYATPSSASAFPGTMMIPPQGSPSWQI